MSRALLNSEERKAAQLDGLIFGLMDDGGCEEALTEFLRITRRSDLLPSNDELARLKEVARSLDDCGAGFCAAVDQLVMPDSSEFDFGWTLEELAP